MTTESNGRDQTATAAGEESVAKNRLADVAGGSVDPFDNLEALRLSQDFDSAVGVKKVLTTVPYRKPHRHEFVRVRAGEEWRFETAVLEDKTSREGYMVAKPMWPELLGEIERVCLFVTANRQGGVFLWPIKMPGPDGRTNNWHLSARESAVIAQKHWVRVVANMAAGMYDTLQAAASLPQPEWPEESFSEILRKCFQGRFIDSLEHPVLKYLRGEE